LPSLENLQSKFPPHQSLVLTQPPRLPVGKRGTRDHRKRLDGIRTLMWVSVIEAVPCWPAMFCVLYHYHMVRVHTAFPWTIAESQNQSKAANYSSDSYHKTLPRHLDRIPGILTEVRSKAYWF
jgi:hypothetical protein